MWTKFYDRSCDGKLTVPPYQAYFIELPKDEASDFFGKTYGNPEHYHILEFDSFEEASSYHFDGEGKSLFDSYVIHRSNLEKIHDSGK